MPLINIGCLRLAPCILERSGAAGTGRFGGISGSRYSLAPVCRAGQHCAWRRRRLAGAVIQWLMQLPAQWRSGLGGFRLRFDFRQPEVQDVLKIMGPATFSSGMMQINVWTDLFFASFIPNADAAVSAMGYAGLLVQTPLGILSNVILVPHCCPFFPSWQTPNTGGS